MEQAGRWYYPQQQQRRSVDWQMQVRQPAEYLTEQ